jgi:hypothetical protein
MAQSEQQGVYPPMSNSSSHPVPTQAGPRQQGLPMQRVDQWTQKEGTTKPIYSATVP